MDEKIQKVLEEKIRESTSKINEITTLVNSFGQMQKPKCVWAWDNNWKIV